MFIACATAHQSSQTQSVGHTRLNRMSSSRFELMQEGRRSSGLASGMKQSTNVRDRWIKVDDHVAMHVSSITIATRRTSTRACRSMTRILTHSLHAERKSQRASLTKRREREKAARTSPHLLTPFFFPSFSSLFVPSNFEETREPSSLDRTFSGTLGKLRPSLTTLLCSFTHSFNNKRRRLIRPSRSW